MMKAGVQKVTFLMILMGAWFTLHQISFVHAAVGSQASVSTELAKSVQPLLQQPQLTEKQKRAEEQRHVQNQKIAQLKFEEKRPLEGLFDDLRKACDYSKSFVEDPTASKEQNEVNKLLFMYEDVKLRAAFDVLKNNEDRLDRGYNYQKIKKILLFKHEVGEQKDPEIIKGLNLSYSSRFRTLDVLDDKSRQDLELLVGPKSNPKFSLANALCRTSTELGRILFCDKLRKPTADVAMLLQQQAVVKELATNKPLYTEFDDRLKDLQLAENAMLSLWSGHDLNAGFIQKFLFKPLYITVLTKTFKLAPFSDELNKVPWLLEGAALAEFARCDIYGNMLRVKEFFEKGLSLYNLFQAHRAYLKDKNEEKMTAACTDALGYSLFSGPKFNVFKSSMFWTADPSFVITELINKGIEKVNATLYGEGQNKAIETYIRLAFNIMHRFYGLYYLPKHFAQLKKSRICTLQKLIYVAKYVNNAMALIEIALQNPVLNKHITLLKSIQEKLQNRSRDLDAILKLLKAETFKGDASLFHYFGRVIAAYNLLEKVKEEFIPLMVTLGELDAQFSIARLYVESQNSPVKYCFPTYLKPELGTAILARDFWNPVLSADKAIPNSLTLGVAFNAPRNAIITGPNAGGKSTTMKGFILNLLMAQSLGLCAASEFSCTPCSVIMSYNNIVDDIAAGNSHFKAGVVRAKELIEGAKKLKEHECAFMVADEIFNGSSHYESQAAACGFAKILGAQKNVMLIMPTHFEQLTLLPKISDDWANYKVTVNFNEVGKILYTYKLEPGISNQNVAFKILQEEGFQSELVNEAAIALQQSKRKRH